MIVAIVCCFERSLYIKLHTKLLTKTTKRNMTRVQKITLYCGASCKTLSVQISSLDKSVATPNVQALVFCLGLGLTY